MSQDVVAREIGHNWQAMQDCRAWAKKTDDPDLYLAFAQLAQLHERHLRWWLTQPRMKSRRLDGEPPPQLGGQE